MVVNVLGRNIDFPSQLIKLVASLLIGVCLVSTLVGVTVTAAEFNLTTAVSYNSAPAVSPLTLNTMTPFTYYINYACQSTVGDCQGNTIVVDLPKIQPINETLPVGVSKVYDSNTDKYTLTFNNSILSGTTGQIGINMQIREFGVYQGESLPIQVSTISGGNPAETYPSQTFTLNPGNGLIRADGLLIEKIMGDPNQYIINGVANYTAELKVNSNDINDINNVEILDNLPVNTNLTQVKLVLVPGGAFPPSITPTVEYQTDINATWTTMPVLIGQDQWFDISTLGLAAGDRVKAVRVKIPNLPAESIPPNYKTISLQLKGEVISPTEGIVVNNCGDITGINSLTSQVYTNQSCATVTYATPIKALKYYFEKYTDANNPSSPGDIARTSLFFRMDPNFALPVIDPVMYDLLPAGQILEEGPMTIGGGGNCILWYCVADSNYTSIMGPIVTKTPNYNNTGRTLLKFDWSGASSLTLDGLATNPAKANLTALRVFFKVKLDPTLTRTTLTNIGYGDSANTETKGPGYCTNETNNGTDDIYDVNGNGSVIDRICRDFKNTNVLPPPGSSELNSIKYVKGDLDTVYSKYPDVGNVTSGGNIDYRIAISNPAGAVKDLDIYDIFPSLGDRGVVSPELRYSSWRPFLKAPISLPAGVTGTVYYTTVNDPCRDALSSNGITPFPTGCNPAGWSTAPPSLIGTTTGVRFDLTGYTIPNGGSIEINYQMKAATNSSFNNTVAWNSFGYVSTSVASGLKLLPSEPVKVGIKYFATDLFSLGNRVWIDTDKDGLLNNGETGIDGVKVNLLDSAGAAVLDGTGQPTTTLTASGGYYRFDNLATGDYIAEIPASNFVGSGLLTGYVSSPIDEVVANNDIDGNDNGIGELNTVAGIKSSIITLAKPEPLGETDLVAGANPQGGADDLGNMTLDFGFYKLATITGKIFLDSNNNGIQDGTEPNTTVGNPIPAGTTVTITDTTTPAITFTAIINTDGTYSQNVPDGTYTVTVAAPAAYTITGGSNPTTVTASLAAAVDAGLDGLYNPATITGQIFLDPNNNGIQDGTEPNTTLGNPIPAGTTVTITDTTTPAITFTAVINTNGTYSQSLPAGTYAVTVVAPVGYTITGSPLSNPTTVTVTPGSSVSTGKDGLYNPATITGQIFLDPNNNGIQDGTEPNTTLGNPIPAGTTVTITDTTTPAITFTALLNTNGTYSQSIPAGTYSVTVVAPI
ncbi:MAG: hypothetical protein H7230_02325, partial [Candidatus Parcubacteria bacterium]|nr:hypothetical protein [Candidatus Paceibacterota bacterium]